MPRLQLIRSISKFGLSQVVVYFEDGTDIYFARQVVNERLGTVQIPPGIERPKMGPVSTGLGEVFHYVVTGQGDDVTQLRTIHDWVIKPKLRTVKGTAEVNSWGGYEKQYQVRIDPTRLIKHGLTFDEVVEAVERNNRNVGGGNIRQDSQMLLVHGFGRTVNVEQIKNIVVTAKEGVPIRVQDVADVEIGHEIRRGAVTADGKGEVVLGLGFMLMGENSHEVTWNLKRRLEEIKPTLPCEREGRNRLRPHGTGRSRHRHGARTTCSRAGCWSSSCCSPSWATCGRQASSPWRSRCRCCSPSPGCCGSASPPACSAWGPSTSAWWSIARS